MSDKKLIDDLIKEEGSLTLLSRKLGFSTQRVNNWRKRGIPARVKLLKPDIFLKADLSKAQHNQE